jgi:hypothetical protein
MTFTRISPETGQLGAQSCAGPSKVGVKLGSGGGKTQFDVVFDVF